MDQVKNLLKSIPFLMHLSNEEHELFFKAGRFSSLKAGQAVDLKKSNSLNIVINGMFEIETIANSDVVYLSPGSFFGFLPFAENRIKGNVRALTDSRIFIINEDEFYRFFLKSHKALRGYLRMIRILGFDVNESGTRYSENRSKVVSVYSMTAGSGKSYLSSLLSLSLSGEKVVLLDLSYSGKTVFDFFGQRLTVPLSVKDSGAANAESLINDRIVKYSENLHLLNISYSSRVKTDPGILGPVLMFLSRNYRYIVVDVSDDDHELRNRIFTLSDFVFALTDGKKDIDDMQVVFDSVINEGQRIFYVRNSYVNPEKGSFYGGLILNKCDTADAATPQSMERFIEDGNLSTFTERITGKSRALVLPSSRLESILLCSLLSELGITRKSIDYIYSSSYTFFLASLFVLFEDDGILRDNMKRFFSSEQTAKNLDITFPEKFIFRNSRILKYTSELSSSKRMEMFHPLPLCALKAQERNVIMSTGPLSRVMAASLVSSPEYEPVGINGTEYVSGFPELRVNPAHLFRIEADEIVSVSVNNREELRMVEGSYNEFYSASLRAGESMCPAAAEYLEHGKNLILDVSESEYKFDKIYNSTLKISQLLLTRII